MDWLNWNQTINNLSTQTPEPLMFFLQEQTKP